MIKKFIENLAYIFVFCVIAGIFASIAQGMRALHDPVAYAEHVLTRGSDGRVCAALFSPDNDVKQALIGLIRATRGHIYATAFTLTDMDIAQALIDQHNQGVPVEIITDKNCMNTEWSKIPILGNHDICIYAFPKVLKDKTQDKAQENQRFKRDPLMHNKFIVFVDTIAHKTLVWTGSFNLSRAANEVNQENVIIVENAHLADLYRKHFRVIALRSSLVSGMPFAHDPLTAQSGPSWFDRVRQLVVS
jgi:Phosphatidylserine/phosphatidylglycerophosphate/cardiolipin synthases and related enzymes